LGEGVKVSTSSQTSPCASCNSDLTLDEWEADAMILGVWSASLTLPDYGRLARHAPAIACDGELGPEGGTCPVSA